MHQGDLLRRNLLGGYTLGEEGLIVSRNTLQSHTLVRVRPRIMREKGGRGKEGEENGRQWGKGTEKGTEEKKLRKGGN